MQYFHGKVIWVIGFDVKNELIQDILTKMRKLALPKTAIQTH